MAWIQCLLLQKAFLDLPLSAPDLKVIPYFWSSIASYMSLPVMVGEQQSEHSPYASLLVTYTELYRQHLR